jgi:hypothetical protein
MNLPRKQQHVDVLDSLPEQDVDPGIAIRLAGSRCGLDLISIGVTPRQKAGRPPPPAGAFHGSRSRSAPASVTAAIG